ncbi:type II secretion system F family protein [Anatilimnocola floriformis]|uniref:type II secretion system F family protein n=1 Tax=Anatilimnocola floriformis TaxID=2948575 RepID=UPI0020C3E859|nr:type II secretion system F family protein [Anatilimnocola floriformis]
MPRFVFAAHDRGGRTQTGVLELPSYDAAVDMLRQRQWIVLDMQIEQEATVGAGFSLEKVWQLFPVRLGDIELSLRQLAVMLRSGLTLLESLRLLTENSNRASMRLTWTKVADEILNGESLGNAMTKHACFPAAVVQLTRVGEQTGELDVVLTRSAESIEAWRRLRSQILTAMAYPLLVFIAACGVSAFMVFNVIPKLQTFLTSMGKQLPAITQLLVDITTFINNHIWYGVGGVTVLTIVTVAARLWPTSREFTDRVLLYVPAIGRVFTVAGTAALARNLGTLLRSGVTVLDSLHSVEQLLANKHLARVISEARTEVVQGRTLADALRGRGGFTPMICKMIAIGESSGRLDDVMDEAARYYEDDLRRAISTLAALVEPAMLLIVGGIVGFVYIAFFMAMFAAAR